MRDDYKITSTTAKLEISIEKSVCDMLNEMATYTKLTPDEISNTALKRFISQHKDFFPPQRQQVMR